MRLDIQVLGVRDILQQLNAYEGRQLEAAAKAGLKKGMQRIVVPAIKAEAPQHHGSSPWQRYPSKKRKGGPLARKITVRVQRKRPGEMAAVKAGPNTWYDHMVIGGTKPHIITARDSTGRATSQQVRVMNRHPESTKALFFNGIFRDQVRHPGAKPNPFVHRAAVHPGLAEALARAINDELKVRRKLK